ncbi:MAG: hypothetical protein AAGK17_13490 [Pseudomonadota bacterium]
MTYQPSQPRLPAATISRSPSGFLVSWQDEGRPRTRQFSDGGSAYGFAYTMAAMRDVAVLDLTGAW